MKICENCKRELADEMFNCPYCSQELYENAIKLSKTTNIVSLILILSGIIFALFVNAWAGAVICFVSEMIGLIPNTKLNGIFKKVNDGIADKKKLKTDIKALSKNLKLKNKNYKHSFIISSVAFVLMITFILFDFILPITKSNSNTSQNNPTTTSESVNEDYPENIATEEDVAETTEDIITTEDSAAQLQDEPIVGNWDYSHTCDANGYTAYTTYPYINYFHIVEDGTGNITWKTMDSSTPYLFSEVTWEVYEVNNISGYTTKAYALHITDGFLSGETAYVTWSDKDNNFCFTMNLSNNTYNFYERNTTTYNY